MNLDNFANCKIWLETTDTANRITYAALAEKEQETVISSEEQPTTSTKPDTAVKTGDSTNILLWSMVTVISLAGMLTALFFKRRKCR